MEVEFKDSFEIQLPKNEALEILQNPKDITFSKPELNQKIRNIVGPILLVLGAIFIVAGVLTLGAVALVTLPIWVAPVAFATALIAISVFFYRSKKAKEPAYEAWDDLIKATESRNPKEIQRTLLRWNRKKVSLSPEDIQQLETWFYTDKNSPLLILHEEFKENLKEEWATDKKDIKNLKEKNQKTINTFICWEFLRRACPSQHRKIYNELKPLFENMIMENKEKTIIRKWKLIKKILKKDLVKEILEINSFKTLEAGLVTKKYFVSLKNKKNFHTSVQLERIFENINEWNKNKHHLPINLKLFEENVVQEIVNEEEFKKQIEDLKEKENAVVHSLVSGGNAIIKEKGLTEASIKRIGRLGLQMMRKAAVVEEKGKGKKDTKFYRIFSRVDSQIEGTKELLLEADDKEIKLLGLIEPKLLGEGSFGIVKKIYYFSTREFYALKISKKRRVGAWQLKQEMETLAKIRVELDRQGVSVEGIQPPAELEINLGKRQAAMIKLYEGDSLKDFLKSPSSLQKRKLFAKKLMKSFENILKSGFLYFDIKTSNVLLDKEHEEIVYADFGGVEYKEKISGAGSFTPSTSHVNAVNYYELCRKEMNWNAIQYNKERKSGSNEKELRELVKQYRECKERLFDCARKRMIFSQACILFELLTNGEPPFNNYQQYKLNPPINTIFPDITSFNRDALIDADCDEKTIAFLENILTSRDPCCSEQEEERLMKSWNEISSHWD